MDSPQVPNVLAKTMAPAPCQRCHTEYEVHTEMGHSMFCAGCCAIRNANTAAIVADKGFLLGTN
jgi:hypothetical protein